MNWLSNFIRPRISSLVSQKDVPDNLWQKCPDCEGMLFHAELSKSQNVCYHCGHHLPIDVITRLNLIFDNGEYKTIPTPKVPQDPLKFKDRKRYADRLKDSQHKTKRRDAIVIAKGSIGGQPAVIAAFDFAFMGGSMGAAVGEGIVKAAEVAVKEGAALITIPASGGARMQEGVISLMQMPRTIIATKRVKNAGLPYIVLLTNPTTGGVSASFAMVGDIHMAEPGCMIGFAGRRVIEETVREKLPEDFQTAEYLLEHGMVDMVVPRGELQERIGQVLGLLMNPQNGPKAAKDAGKGGKDATAQGSQKASGKSKGGARASIKRKKIPVKKPANTQNVKPAGKKSSSQ